MKFSTTLFVLFLFVANGFSQGIHFYKGSWEDAKQLAKKEHKLIFVDAYAKWCGPCKRMARNVFTDATVGEYYNDNFINMKIDMEEGMGREFRQSYPVSAYPTLLYIDDKGEVVKKVVGGRNVSDFLKMGKDIVKSFDRSKDYAVRYEKGDRSYELVYEYVKALNQAQKPSQKVANDFLRKNTDLKRDDKTKFLYEALTAVDSRIYNMYTADRKNIETLIGKKEYLDKIEEAAWNTVYSAVDFEVVELLEEAQSKVKKALPQKRAMEFEQQSKYVYAQSTSNIPMMADAASELAEGSYKTSPDQLMELSEELSLYKALFPKVKEVSYDIMAQAVKISDNPMHRVQYAHVLAEDGDKKKAMKEAKKALKMIPPVDEEYEELTKFIEGLKK